MGNSLKAILFFEAVEQGNLSEVIRLHEKEQASFELRRSDEVRIFKPQLDKRGGNLPRTLFSLDRIDSHRYC